MPITVVDEVPSSVFRPLVGPKEDMKVEERFVVVQDD